MAQFEYAGIGISALAAAVPTKVYDNLRENPWFSTEDAAAIVEKTGIFQRRIAPAGMTASDLCFAATEKLLIETGLVKTEVDALIMVTQTPDYRMPASAIIMQHRLGLPKSTMAYDVNLGCSGFVVGLNLAYSLLQQNSIKNVLLLNGETRTRVYSFRDRQTGFLFGDAGSACLLQKDVNYGRSFFRIDSDGAKADYIMIKYGGYRNPSTPESLIEKDQENGHFHSDEQAYMDGAGVFEFVITEVPKHIKSVLQKAGQEVENIDYFVFHQANKFMNEHLNRKLKLPANRVPFSLDRFGNTSSVSIPLTMVTELGGKLAGRTKLLVSGFGVGLSLGSAVLELNDPYISKLVEV